MIYGDEQRLIWPGAGDAGARVICAMNRPADAPYPVTTGRDENGEFVRFQTMKGDRSLNEQRQYGDKDCPMRAMISLESLGGVRRHGALIRQRFSVMLEPGWPVAADWFTVLSQENAGPPRGEGWRPPPIECGLVLRGRMQVRKSDGKRVAAKDPATGKQIMDEWLYLKGHVWDAGKKRAVDVGLVTTDRPVRRGELLRDVELIFRDGRSGPGGHLELRVGGQRQGRVYDGPLGYENFGSLYPGFGVYQHWVQRPLAARYYGWQEDVLPA